MGELDQIYRPKRDKQVHDHAAQNACALEHKHKKHLGQHFAAIYNIK